MPNIAFTAAITLLMCEQFGAKGGIGFLILLFVCGAIPSAARRAE